MTPEHPDIGTPTLELADTGAPMVEETSIPAQTLEQVLFLCECEFSCTHAKNHDICTNYDNVNGFMINVYLSYKALWKSGKMRGGVYSVLFHFVKKGDNSLLLRQNIIDR